VRAEMTSGAGGGDISCGVHAAKNGHVGAGKIFGWWSRFHAAVGVRGTGVGCGHQQHRLWVPDLVEAAGEGVAEEAGVREKRGSGGACRTRLPLF
jgi:hypothetical protein